MRRCFSLLSAMSIGMPPACGPLEEGQTGADANAALEIGLAATQSPIYPGSFINQGEYIWSTAASTVAGNRSVTRTTTGITVRGPTGSVYVAASAGKVPRYKFFGSDNNLAILMANQGPGPMDESVGLVDFTTTPPTYRQLFSVHSDSTLDLPHVNYSQTNGAAVLIYGFSSPGREEVNTAVHLSGTGEILCSVPGAHIPTGQTVARATATNLVISYSSGGVWQQVTCPLP